MTLLSSTVDSVYFLSFKTFLRRTQQDDVAFLAFLLLLGVFYHFCFKDKPDPYHHVWFEKPQQTDLKGKEIETRDIAAKLEKKNKDLVIFWGSQSGTAEGFANRLVRDFRSRFGFNALSANLADYDPESIAHIPDGKFAVFVISTYGEGDPSDNATHFVSWLGSNKTIRFPKLRYAAFGLGNKNYKYYNRVVDIVAEALSRYGATALMPTGKADDSAGTTDEDFTAWKHALFKLFHEEMGFEERPSQYDPVLKVVEDTSLDVIDLHLGEPLQTRNLKKSITATSGIQVLPISAARKLLPTTIRNCLHLELDTSSFPELKYKTGDHLAVWPSNPISEVNRLVNALGLQGRTQTPLLIQALDSSVKTQVPSPTTWQALLQHYLEICAPIPRETVIALAQFAPSESSKVALEELSSGKDAYHDYCSRNHVTLGRLLESVSPASGSWSSLPLAFILENLSTLSPRYYSISSSSIVSPKQISITVATSSEASPGRHVSIPGLTTEYLSTLEAFPRTESAAQPKYNLTGLSNVLGNGRRIFAQVRTSKFRLPAIPKHPIIMIAAGSGIAPFRGFLVERARMTAIGREVGTSLLFFGCRSEEDFLYRDELSELQVANRNIAVMTAFSRSPEQKSYVQDRIEERGEQVVRLLLEQNAYLYICGSASMARDVAARIGGCMRNGMGWGESELREWSESMKKSHRWQEDVWG